jgi:rod shape determining protein RodA
LGALLLLSAYGVVMIYSATINTLGVEDSVRRQALFVASGTAVLLVTASVDYRLLEIVQHPFPILTPIVLALVDIGMIFVWRTGQLPAVEDTLSVPAMLPELGPVLAGVVLIAAVYVADQLWLEELDLTLMRLLLTVGVVAAVGLGGVYLYRKAGPALLSGGPGLNPDLVPYIMVVGLGVLYLLDCLTLRVSDILRNPFYVLILVLLGVIFVVGQVAGGSQRWLGAGMIQPSELAKIMVIVVLAKFLADHQERMEKLSTVLVSLGIVALPMLLIYLQPDLGTALTLLAIWAAMVWVSKVRLRHLMILAVIGSILLPLIWFNLEEYMRQRVMLFVNPAGDPDSYFNVHQSLVSIGSGGWTGKGLTQGTQSQLHFLRVRHTDFIFAVAAEELGFLGALAIMGLIIFILWRILRISERSMDTFGRAIAAGVGALVLFQAGINIGMNLGLMPVTGIPLPFVSYGGSSLITLMLGMGLVESIAMRQKKLEFD